MKKLAVFISSCALVLATSSAFAGTPCLGGPCRALGKNNITNQIPTIQPSTSCDGYQKVVNVTQQKNADWSNVVGIAHGISVSEACAIANENPEISFFFYTKGGRMVLETKQGDFRLFRYGDAVFFSGKPSWGTAPGLADGYIKNA